MNPESLEAYKQALRAHDWYFEYSDDHTVWKRGSEQQRKLKAMRDQLDPTGAIWNTFGRSA